MNGGQALAFVIFATIVAVTPGPSNILLAAIGASSGVRRGLGALLGITLGVTAIVFLVAFGLGNVILEHGRLLDAGRIAAIGFILWLAFKIATAGPPAREAPPAAGFWSGAAMQVVNPKPWLVASAAAGAYLGDGGQNAFVRSGTLALLFLLVAIPSCLVWLAGGAALQRHLRSDRSWRIFNRTMALLLVGSVVLLLLE
jgi:threonine/homoserine/homoserine lactone efflux protein